MVVSLEYRPVHPSKEEERNTLVAFQALVQGEVSCPTPTPSRFVKKFDNIPSVDEILPESRSNALHLAETALVGKFTGLWSSTKIVEQWSKERWEPKVKNPFSQYHVGQGFFVFLFANKEDRDIIFHSWPYFMGNKGMYLTPWTLDFNPDSEISVAPVWIRMLHLPLHLWEVESNKDIGNKLGCFLEKASPKAGWVTCARICVEVDLEKELSEAIKINVGNWSHNQVLNYEQIPFKCNVCHVYGHFVEACPKNQEAQRKPLNAKNKESEFQLVTKRRRNQQRENMDKSSSAAREAIKPFNGNRSEALSTPEETLEDPPQESPEMEEIPPPADLKEGEEAPLSSAPTSSKMVQLEDDEVAPVTSTYAATVRKDRPPSPPSTRGRKSNQEKRETEACDNIFAGSQPTLERAFRKGRQNNL